MHERMPVFGADLKPGGKVGNVGLHTVWQFSLAYNLGQGFPSPFIIKTLEDGRKLNFVQTDGSRKQSLEHGLQLPIIQRHHAESEHIVVWQW